MTGSVWVVIECNGGCQADFHDEWSRWVETGYGAGVEPTRLAIAAYLEEHGCPDCHQLAARLIAYSRYDTDDDDAEPVEDWDAPDA